MLTTLRFTTTTHRPHPGPLQPPGQRVAQDQRDPDLGDPQRRDRQGRGMHVADRPVGHPHHARRVRTGHDEQGGHPEATQRHPRRHAAGQPAVDLQVPQLVQQQPDEQDVEVAGGRHVEGEPADVEQRDHDQQHGDHAGPEAGVQPQGQRGQGHDAQVGAEEPQRLVEQPAERPDAHSPGPIQDQPQHRHHRDVQPGRDQDPVDPAVDERRVPLAPAPRPLPAAPVGIAPDEEEQGDHHEQPRERPHRGDLVQGAGLHQPSPGTAVGPPDVGHEPVPDHHGDDAPAAQQVDEAIPAPGLHAWNGTRRGRPA